MKLQISFNLTDLDKALEIATDVVDYCDIVEIDTMLLYAYGLEAVRRFRQEFPKKTLLVDTKLTDGQEAIIDHLAHAGVDWITVLAGATKEAIHTLCKEAAKYNVKVMLDLLDASTKAQSAMEAKHLGADALLFHQTYTQESSLIFLDTWEMVKGNASLPIFISARINRDNFERIVSLNPYGVVIGRSIVESEDPAQEAQYYYGVLSKD